ncbi:MAG TPA: hypothetical protein VHS09_13220 [Polyangiaceae bacterium]|jgi:hypothetical protein|nr:hypothetical protein [Polyangiaceae bacterium]
MTSFRCSLLLARLATTAAAAGLLALAGGTTGCQATLSPPFDQMKGAQMTVYRLQNYVPPSPPTAAPALGGVQLPPQIQQWISAGASLIPPGLLPPGLLPGTTPAPVQGDTQRFPPTPQGFPILGYQQVTDPALANDILETLGHPSNFQPPAQSCMYAELGIAIAQANNPQPADFLVSLSCMQIQASNVAWPYQNTGLNQESEKRFASILQRAFGGH